VILATVEPLREDMTSERLILGINSFAGTDIYIQ